MAYIDKIDKIHRVAECVKILLRVADIDDVSVDCPRGYLTIFHNHTGADLSFTRDELKRLGDDEKSIARECLDKFRMVLCAYTENDVESALTVASDVLEMGGFNKYIDVVKYNELYLYMYRRSDPLDGFKIDIYDEDIEWDIRDSALYLMQQIDGE